MRRAHIEIVNGFSWDCSFARSRSKSRGFLAAHRKENAAPTPASHKVHEGHKLSCPRRHSNRLSLPVASADNPDMDCLRRINECLASRLQTRNITVVSGPQNSLSCCIPLIFGKMIVYPARVGFVDFLRRDPCHLRNRSNGTKGPSLSKKIALPEHIKRVLYGSLRVASFR